MPVHNGYSFIPDPNNPRKSIADPKTLLRYTGPRIIIAISVPSALVNVLAAQSRGKVPNPITGSALIDTGASSTCVDEVTVAGLGIPATSYVDVQAPTGTKTKPIYPVNLEFHGTDFEPIEPLPVLGAELEPQGIIALIGRDILERCVLVYNGPGGMYTLST